MTQKLLADNTRQVVLVGKLLKDARRGAAHGVSEINRVSEIDGKGYTVDDDEEPLAYLLIYPVLFPMQWEEHHDDIQYVRINDSRSIKQQASPESLKGIGEIFRIFQVILQTCYLID